MTNEERANLIRQRVKQRAVALAAKNREVWSDRLAPAACDPLSFVNAFNALIDVVAEELNWAAKEAAHGHPPASP